MLRSEDQTESTTLKALSVEKVLLDTNVLLIIQLIMGELIGNIILYSILISYIKQKMNLTEEYPGFFSLLSSLDNAPIERMLAKWGSNVQNGHIKRLTDQQIDLPVIQICGTNINNNYLTIPNNPKNSLKMKMPIIVLLVKNLDKYFRFEVTILDNKNIKRTFVSSNNQSITRIKPFECSMPLQLDDGWNQIVFDLEQYCEKAFGTHFVECVSFKINANCRIARVYFNDARKTQQMIPADYKLFMRVQTFKM